jgi:hypothetical protein
VDFLYYRAICHHALGQAAAAAADYNAAMQVKVTGLLGGWGWGEGKMVVGVWFSLVFAPLHLMAGVFAC